MSRLDQRITRLEDRALSGPGELAPKFTSENGQHVSARMLGIGTLYRGESETNAVFEQRVFREVIRAASRGTFSYAQLSDEALGSCCEALSEYLRAAGIDVDELDSELVRAWLNEKLGRQDGAQQ